MAFRMDMMNATNPPEQPPVWELAAYPKVVGIKQLKKALQAGRVLRVFLAKDADPQLTGELCRLCSRQGVPVACVATMAGLGKACAIDVGAAAAAALHP